MICNNCGKKLDDNLMSCPICGKVFSTHKPLPSADPSPAHSTAQAPVSAPTPPTIQNVEQIQSSQIYSVDNSMISLKNKTTKRKVLIFSIAILAVILIISLVIAFRPAESKIQGTWQLVEASSNSDFINFKEEGQYITYVFSKGYLIMYDHNNNSQEEGYYRIDGNILEMYDDKYRENNLWGNSNRYVIEKISTRELIIKKVDSSSGKRYRFKKI